MTTGSIGVPCRWDYTLMAGPTTALAETRRVLRCRRAVVAVGVERR